MVAVARELGFDTDGDVAHRHPGGPARAKHGAFDLAKIASPESADMEPEELDRRWPA